MPTQSPVLPAEIDEAIDELDTAAFRLGMYAHKGATAHFGDWDPADTVATTAAVGEQAAAALALREAIAAQLAAPTELLVELVAHATSAAFALGLAHKHATPAGLEHAQRRDLAATHRLLQAIGAITATEVTG